MPEFVEAFARQLALGTLMQSFYAFTLVLVRMAGLMTIGPIFGQRLVPINVRVLLVFTMAVLITPTLPRQTARGFARLDTNRDGRLIRDEVPQQLRPRFERLLKRADKQPEGFLTAAEYEFSVLQLAIPPTFMDYAWVAVGEFSLGLVLGVGVLIILSGLQLAGELIDQQTGLSLGEISNPGLEINGSITGQFLFLFGTTLLLVMEPLNGHLMMVGSLVETFQTLPVGEAGLASSTVDLLNTLVHQSLMLGIRVAAPLLAVMSLVALTMGFLGHTVPQLNVLVIGFPVRASVSLVVLGFVIAGAADQIVVALPETIDTLRGNLSGLE
ncbi:MAG: flagellar biosynthetic protein FliR [Planctomycetaceae bacterium]